ncbi:MAG: M56 family metallopeptidase [Clostridia bacterium]|nr:M56 family metallopeptidase [Clostridia bacterium]
MSLLRMSLSGALLILAIAALRALALHRLPKRTFTALWTVALARLLVPFEIPFRFSVDSLVQEAAAMRTTALSRVAANSLPAAPSAAHAAIAVAGTQIAASPAAPVSGWTIAYWIGFGLLALGFGRLYLRALRDFRAATPLRQPTVDEWLAGHPCLRRIQVRQSDRIGSPMTYGLLRPVILIPALFDWGDARRLDAVLTHEYVHIRHLDALRKLLMIAALCVHWFNPAVWLMFSLFNRDLELRCDERAVRLLGYDHRRDYARALVELEEEKRRVHPMFSHFNRTAIEQRITSIARMRRRSLATLLAAILLVAGVTTAFATSAGSADAKTAAGNPPGAETLDALPDEHEVGDSAPKATSDAAALRQAFQVDGYEAMSVGEFREIAGRIADEPEMWRRLENCSQDEALYALRSTNDDAAFLFYVAEPLLAERWQQREFSGAVTSGDSGDRAVLEYGMTLRILDADRLTVGAYARIPADVGASLQQLLRRQSPETLADADAMDALLLEETERLCAKLSSDALRVGLEYGYKPLDATQAPSADARLTASGEAPNPGASEPGGDEAEPRLYDRATEADYRSLLALMAPDYAAQTVAEFDEALLRWCDEHPEAMERIVEDAFRDEIAVELTPEEHEFVARTFLFSREENIRSVASLSTGAPEAEPTHEIRRLTKETSAGGRAAWCCLDVQFRYSIADKDVLTVGERDARLAGLIADVWAFWQDSDIESLLQMDEGDVLESIQAIAGSYSDDALTVHIDEDDLFFEHADERRLSD